MGKMNEIIDKFAMLILREMEKNNQSCLQFSELCGVGRNIVADIINGKKKDVKLSTIYNICENSDIRLEDIFTAEKREPLETYLVMDGERYLIELHKVKNTPTPRKNSHD